ncbi:unnamed protein product [Symbiodinium sp. KB8]|nr:unnamed protein product [Symbiodinium sp. KB8]
MHSRFASATAACAVMRAEERGVSIVTRRVLYRQQLRIREIHLHASPFRLHEVVHCCQRVRTFLFERRVDELLHLSKERSADVQPRYDFDGAATVGTGALASWLPLGESVLSDSINADESERSSHATIGQIAIRSSDAVCERSRNHRIMIATTGYLRYADVRNVIAPESALKPQLTGQFCAGSRPQASRRIPCYFCR